MRQSATAPNLHEYANKFEEQPRKPTYSRHYEYDYNGHRIPRSSNGFNNNLNENNENQGRLKPSTSLSLLPLARDVTQNGLSYNDKYNRPGSDWNLTTTKRAFR